MVTAPWALEGQLVIVPQTVLILHDMLLQLLGSLAWLESHKESDFNSLGFLKLIFKFSPTHLANSLPCSSPWIIISKSCRSITKTESVITSNQATVSCTIFFISENHVIQQAGNGHLHVYLILMCYNKNLFSFWESNIQNKN
jgi:hypothetical protein